VEKRVPRSGSNFLHRAQQPQIALLDQVGQRQPAIEVTAGDLHDEAQVGLGHPLLGRLVAGPRAPRECLLLLAREQRDARDLGEVHAEVRAARLARLVADVLVHGVHERLERLVGTASSASRLLIGLFVRLVHVRHAARHGSM